MLIFIAILAFALKQNYHISTFMQSILKKKLTEPIDMRSVTMQMLKDHRYSKVALHNKAQIVQHVVELLNMKRASKLLITFGLGFYLLFLLPPMLPTLYFSYLMSVSGINKEDIEKSQKFYDQITQYRGLKQANEKVNYTLKESMDILDHYLKPQPKSKIERQNNLLPCNLPDDLMAIYAWRNGIENLTPLYNPNIDKLYQKV